MNIQPIQTRYAGCHFRSRLGARYAVFFDALGIRWEYEPEGFSLPNGTQYLPDFWLPSMSAYIEIKAELRPIEVKWREFHQVINGPASWQLPDFVVDHPTQRTASTNPTTEADFHVRRPPPPHAFPTLMSCGHPFDPSDDSYHMTVELEAAYNAARSARFEHGESGPS